MMHAITKPFDQLSIKARHVQTVLLFDVWANHMNPVWENFLNIQTFEECYKTSGKSDYRQNHEASVLQN